MTDKIIQLLAVLPALRLRIPPRSCRHTLAPACCLVAPFDAFSIGTALSIVLDRVFVIIVLACGLVLCLVSATTLLKADCTVDARQQEAGAACTVALRD